MSQLILKLQTKTKDQHLIEKMESCLQYVGWDLIIHRPNKDEIEYSLELNMNNKDFWNSLEKLSSLLLTMQSSNCSGSKESDSILKEYSHTVHKLESMFMEGTDDGGWASIKSPNGMK